MKWRWYTTWWLLPRVPSLSAHHDLSSTPSNPSFSLSLSRFRPPPPPPPARRVPRFLPGVRLSGPYGFSARRTSYLLLRQIHLGSPGAPGFPLQPPVRRRIAADRGHWESQRDSLAMVRPFARSLARSPADWLADWLVGQHPPSSPLVEYRRVAAPCVSSHPELPFGEPEPTDPLARTGAKNVISPEISSTRRSRGDSRRNTTRGMLAGP